MAASDSETDSDGITRVTRPLKRKASSAHATKPPASKRHRSASTVAPQTPADDPTRRYCAGKLREVLEPIFLAYHGWDASNEGEPPKDRQPENVDELKAKADVYVQELEGEIFAHYADAGQAGSKYKERFRMLTFNLSKADRTHLRRRIGLGELQPSVLAQMSSTELASEQGQAAIAEALQASLASSILEQPRLAAPRAKMTHKGTEMIESYDVPMQMQHAIEAPVQSKDMLPPIVTQLPKGESEEKSSVVESPAVQRSAYFIPSMSTEPGLTSEGSTENVDALIPNSPTAEKSLASPTRRTSFDLGALWQNNSSAAASLDPLSVDHHTYEPGTMDYSFDGDDNMALDLAALPDDGPKDDADFDMFIEHDATGPPAGVAVTVKSAKPTLSPEEITRQKFDGQQTVFSGDCIMPDMPVFKVDARQVGGRSLANLQTWTSLFTHPSKRIGIDGRVPVPTAAKYLLDSRLNPGRELVAVVFVPATEADEEAFATFFDLLVKKEYAPPPIAHISRLADTLLYRRYAVSHPWGSPPPPHAPGKELYICSLPADAPIPEAVDMLDNMCLPRNRDRTMLLGVFTLHKGRVVDMPITSSIPPVAGPSITSMPPTIPVIPGLAALLNLPGLAPPAPAPAPVPVVPSLTSEQIHLMLRTLGHLSQPSQPVVPVMAPPPAIPGFAPVMVAPLPMSPNIPNYAAPPTTGSVSGFGAPPPSGPRGGGAFRGGRGGPPPLPLHAAGRGGRGGARGRSGGFMTGANADAGDERRRDAGWGSRGRGRG